MIYDNVSFKTRRMAMKNQLALSGERIVEKVYQQLFHHVGMIRGEYLLRELNQNILLASC